MVWIMTIVQRDYKQTFIKNKEIKEQETISETQSNVKPERILNALFWSRLAVNSNDF